MARLDGKIAIVTGAAGGIGGAIARAFIAEGAHVLAVDIRDGGKLAGVVADFQPDAVIHFAGLKAVGASEKEPLPYYENNVLGTLSLLLAMDSAGCKRVVFSSSATVYGEPQYLPYDEDHPLNPANTYGRTKLMAEQVIRDWCRATDAASAALLRYFNPVGAHSSGDIGEDPGGVPDNLMPYIAQVAVGRRPHLEVFGDDYETRDGTGERDYIHVVDLARAHVAAIDFVSREPGCDAFNIGTGKAYSVMDMVKAFEAASLQKIPVQIAGRRKGDLASYYADAGKANKRLAWGATLGLEDICKSAWAWQSKNPEGYR